MAREMMADSGAAGCGLGSGALVVAAGYVEGTLSPKPVLTVLLNPTGDHGGTSAGGSGEPPVSAQPPNWYVGFLVPGGRVVSVQADGRPGAGAESLLHVRLLAKLAAAADARNGDVLADNRPRNRAPRLAAQVQKRVACLRGHCLRSERLPALARIIPQPLRYDFGCALAHSRSRSRARHRPGQRGRPIRDGATWMSWPRCRARLGADGCR